MAELRCRVEGSIPNPWLHAWRCRTSLPAGAWERAV